MSKASQLAAAINARISAITVANGYNTDIGATVYRGKRTANEDKVPFAFIIEGDDQVIEQTNMTARVVIAYAVEGHATCDPDNPNDTVHLIVADLKKAIFGGDVTFGGLLRQRPGTEPTLKYQGRTVGEREDGAKVVGAGVMFSCEILEDLPNP